jgi:hypothetical protein
MDPSPPVDVDMPAADLPAAVDMPAVDLPADVDMPAADPPAAGDLPGVDLVIGLATWGLRGAGALLYVTRPVAMLALRPPLVPAPLQPQTWLLAIARQGREVRERATPQVEALVTQVVEGVVARVDFEAVIHRMDLPTIARQVVDDIDLPVLIRDSTGSLASEGVVGLRMQGIEADERVSKIVDKVLLRRNSRKTQVRPHADEPVP